MKYDILLIGEKYSPNLGDGLIYDVVYRLLNKHLSILELDFAGKINYDSPQIRNNKNTFIINEQLRYVRQSIIKAFNLNNIVKKKIEKDPLTKNYKRALRLALKSNQINAIMFSGGQLFMDCFLEKMQYTIILAKKYNIPVIFNACGKGDIKNTETIKTILKSDTIQYISVRDSYEYLKEISNIDIHKTYDTAILANKFYKRAQSEEIFGLGVMLSRRQSIQKQIKFWTGIINYFEKNNLRWELFCNGNMYDYDFCKYLLRKLNISQNKLSSRPTTPEELISNITKYNHIISMRLHSLIVAYSYNIPAAAIVWDNKVKEFYKAIEHEDLCFNLQETNYRKIVNSLLHSTSRGRRRMEIENNIKENINNIINIVKHPK